MAAYRFIKNCAHIVCTTCACLIIVASTLEAAPNQATPENVYELEEAGLKITLSQLANNEQFRLTIVKAQNNIEPTLKIKTKIFKLEKPTRLVVDIANKIRARSQAITLSHPLFYSIRLGGHTSKARLVLDLKDSVTLKYTKPVAIDLYTAQINFSLLSKLPPEVPSTKTVIKQDTSLKPNTEKHSTAKRAVPSKPALKSIASMPKIEAAAIAPAISTKPALTQVKPLPQSVASKPDLKTEQYRSKGAPQIISPLRFDRMEAKTLPKEPKKVVKKKEVVGAPPAPAESAKLVVATTTKKNVTTAPTGPSTKAYTVTGNNIKVVKINKKRTYSRTPMNPSSGYRASDNSLPSLIDASPSKYTKERDRIFGEINQARKNNLPAGATKPNGATAEEPSAKEAVQLASHALQLEQINERLADLDKHGANPVFPLAETNNIIPLLLALIGVALVLGIFLRRHLLLAIVQNRVTTHKLKETEKWPYLLAQFKILGCKETDSDEDIKSRYRHLVKTFHVDKLTAQELPQEVLALTNEQFRKVQEAYEAVRELRDFS
ncbi:AMIN domain-containing protein [Oligoflexia bacterium]|nr:AMIN domain-containing protein [Oligoflexia bacterium]